MNKIATIFLVLVSNTTLAATVNTGVICGRTLINNAINILQNEGEGANLPTIGTYGDLKLRAGKIKKITPIGVSTVANEAIPCVLIETIPDGDT